MMLALVIMPAVVLFGEGGGGYAQASETLNSVDPTLLSWTEGLTIVGWLSAVTWGLGYFGQPHIIVRFMAIRTVADVPIARNIGMSWMGISLIGAISLVCGAAGGNHEHHLQPAAGVVFLPDRGLLPPVPA